jgi:hypothetical protein
MWRNLLIDFCVFNDHCFNCRGLCSVEGEGNMMLNFGLRVCMEESNRGGHGQDTGKGTTGRRGCDLFNTLVLDIVKGL